MFRTPRTPFYPHPFVQGEIDSGTAHVRSQKIPSEVSEIIAAQIFRTARTPFPHCRVNVGRRSVRLIQDSGKGVRDVRGLRFALLNSTAVT